MKAWEAIYQSPNEKLPWLGAELPVKALNQLLRTLPPGARLLDFGCGNGRLASFLARRGAYVVGCDCSPTAIKQAYPLGNRGSYFLASHVQDCAEFGPFSAMVSWGVLHHYPPTTWSTFLRESSSLLALSPKLMLIGLFDESDPHFCGHLSRVSPTTRSLTYCATPRRLFSALAGTNFVVSLNATLRLKDAGRRSPRVWKYLILTSNSST
jgi:cyclopropane fatty-acyl-phospholipid synthase-like methyltransferase